MHVAGKRLVLVYLSLLQKNKFRVLESIISHMSKVQDSFLCTHVSRFDFHGRPNPLYHRAGCGSGWAGAVRHLGACPPRPSGSVRSVYSHIVHDNTSKYDMYIIFTTRKVMKSAAPARGLRSSSSRAQII
ncbi:hypothetical protein EVAR_103629_1 [Eumeta japonica]|uniref:Uncharacterized protein n=1 Tax=Eumeta variegata TaxID=151549 RepID=A0A4C1ZJI8_EUMVA|nr:hypothetical protein EVAR_103629_1 [Eumeta japonica]